MLTKTLNATRSCLVVDDEKAICQTISLALEPQGWQVRASHSLAEALEAIKEGPFDLALVDLRLDQDSGLDLLGPLLQVQPSLPILMITAYASIPTAVEAMRRGATDYLPKPFTPQELRQAIGQALTMSAHRVRQRTLLGAFVAESKVPGVQQLMEQAQRAAASDMTVLLSGETGVGKGVFAKYIHDQSPRHQAPFVVLTCPSLSQDFLEGDLFGYVKGAFDGAYRDHPGQLAEAGSGTLFLDEIGGLPLPMQGKLLEFIQTREYGRIGSREKSAADLRIIAATKQDLGAAVRAGSFREDLYFRLNGLELRLPPLRERLGDLKALVQCMLEDMQRQGGRVPLQLSKAVLKAFQLYSWPGNLRELRNVLERASVLGQGEEVELEDLPLVFQSVGKSGAEAALSNQELLSIKDVEAAHIRKVIAGTRNLEEASRILGIDNVTLWRRRKEYGI